jgi:Zn-dependent M28 family amino/carboxypeptidase
MANVVAVVPGRRADVILVGGHYDTKWFSDRRFVGANDGGSSSGLLIELARQLARTLPEFTYWIVFFDGEEARESWTATDSLYGSRRMAAELSRSQRLPRAVIVVDMIGDRNLNIRREAFSSNALTDLIWAAAARLGHGQHFLPSSMPVEDDHAPFLRAGVPAVLLIDFDFAPWHTGGDTLDTVSPRSLKIVGDVLLEAMPSIERWLLSSPLRRP